MNVIINRGLREMLDVMISDVCIETRTYMHLGDIR